MLRVSDVARILEGWVPRSLAWDRDNVGLQVGDPGTKVRRILVTLDATEAVAAEAARRRTDLIIAHHPTLYRPLRTLDTSTPTGRMITTLIRNGCALYAAHTNLDAARGGTSHVLAETLGLKQVRPLEQTRNAGRKLVTFVPRVAVDTVASAMSGAGAGLIGNYDSCSFRTAGTGTFRGNKLSTPAIGQTGQLQRVDEVRLEMLVENDLLPAVVQAMKLVHPYEEVAYDIYPLDTVRAGTGMGAIGAYVRGLSAPAFLRQVKNSLGAKGLRHSGQTGRTIRTVAVCGGAGAEMLQAAIAAGADAFVTADVSYHAFLEAAGRILLVDAGHYETEHPVVGAVEKFLRSSLGGNYPDVTVTASTVRTSPVVFV
jgi:dinuclear metal center YbgI/SA1388 family protein